MQGFLVRLMGENQIWKPAMTGTSTFIFSAKWASWLLWNQVKYRGRDQNSVGYFAKKQNIAITYYL